MPLVRIDLPADIAEDRRQAIADAVYDCMRERLKVPADDKFMIVTPHGLDELVIDPTYLGIDRSPGALVIQITLNAGRDTETKRAFYRAVAQALQQRAGVRPQDVTINLVEVAKENWSFGNGDAPYAD